MGGATGGQLVILMLGQILAKTHNSCAAIIGDGEIKICAPAPERIYLDLTLPN
jgi:hypothetical protein